MDSVGNVYVALSGRHQVAKYKLVNGSYTLDTTFNGTGLIGKANQTSGTANGEFNTPYDVAVTPDGEEIAVSDSNNHRVQRFTKNGVFIAAFGSLGSSLENLSLPQGLCFRSDGLLQIVDSGNNRLVLARDGSPIQFFGEAGSARTVPEREKLGCLLLWNICCRHWKQSHPKTRPNACGGSQ